MRQEFAAWVFRKIDIDENWLSNVLWTDDAHFSLNGESNIQNSRFWATENPRIFTEMPLYQPRVIVLCGFTSSFIIGPFFFEKSMEELLKPFLAPDLMPCDFCLWGYIKSCVYRCWPTTLAMLKASIRWHVLSISTDMLFNAVHSVIYRLQAVIENEEGTLSKDYDLIQERRQLPHEPRIKKNMGRAHRGVDCYGILSELTVEVEEQLAPLPAVVLELIWLVEVRVGLSTGPDDLHGTGYYGMVIGIGAMQICTTFHSNLPFSLRRKRTVVLPLISKPMAAVRSLRPPKSESCRGVERSRV
ncbi:hypothetical protein LAZ67_7000861 [Cordylochernes scorpioides]|uniref:Uncharacterized protein n=1 Tax=Cordylochernes scorpioides TaxID=51811 RepID=A0ABY6KMD4_9ARAC|nr:hypothetical protein LAZ67_7000861 [Cordylochernes scorpioides]